MTTHIGEALRLASLGYRRVSNRHRLVTRVDRPDWREFMAASHAPWAPETAGMAWVKCLGDGAASHYRRVYSKDDLTVPDEVYKHMPSSDWDPTGYVP